MSIPCIVHSPPASPIVCTVELVLWCGRHRIGSKGPGNLNVTVVHSPPECLCFPNPLPALPTPAVSSLQDVQQAQQFTCRSPVETGNPVATQAGRCTHVRAERHGCRAFSATDSAVSDLAQRNTRMNLGLQPTAGASDETKTPRNILQGWRGHTTPRIHLRRRRRASYWAHNAGCCSAVASRTSHSPLSGHQMINRAVEVAAPVPPPAVSHYAI